MTVNTHQGLPSSNHISSATPSQSCQSSFDPYDLSSDDEEYLTPTNVAETAPGQRDRASRILPAARLYLNSPPEAPKNWGQINPNLNDLHSDPTEFRSTFWIPDITDWWHQHEAAHSKYADLSNVAHNIVSIIPHGVGVEASFSLGWDVIGWRQSKTTGETIRKNVIVCQCACANTGILAGTEPALDNMNTENNSEMKQEAEERTPHSMATVHNLLEIWQGGQNLRATQKESRAQNMQMTSVGYISDTEEIVKASWSLFQHDGVAAFKLSERSPLPPPLSAKDLPGGWPQILNVRWLQRINCLPVKSDEVSARASISDTEHWLNWNGDLDNPNDSEDDCTEDDDSGMDQGDSIEDSQSPEQWNVSATPNVLWLIRPIWKSKRHAENVLVKVNAIETRRNKGLKKQ
jgi:hypothetical protein